MKRFQISESYGYICFLKHVFFGPLLYQMSLMRVHNRPTNGPLPDCKVRPRPIRCQCRWRKAFPIQKKYPNSIRFRQLRKQRIFLTVDLWFATLFSPKIIKLPSRTPKPSKLTTFGPQKYEKNINNDLILHFYNNHGPPRSGPAAVYCPLLP